MLTRRSTFALPALALLGGLGGCSILQDGLPSEKIKAVARDVALIADAMQGILPALAAIPGIDPVKMGVIGQHVGSLKALAEKIRDANTEADAKDLVTQVVDNAQAILSVLSTVGVIPDNIRNVMTAVSVLLPVIQLAVNLLSAPRSLTMTPEEARKLLEDWR